MCVHRVYALYLRRSEKGVRFPGTGVVLGYKLSCGARNKTQVPCNNNMCF